MAEPGGAEQPERFSDLVLDLHADTFCSNLYSAYA